MKRFLFLLVAVLATTIGTMAQDASYFDKWQSSHNWYGDSYLAKQSNLVTAATSSCNQGKEPFITFLKKWNTSSEFRKERIKTVSTEFMSADDSREMILNSLKFLADYKVLPVAANAAKKRTFYAVDANHVGFHQAGCMIQFQRIDGKWYVISLGLAG